MVGWQARGNVVSGIMPRPVAVHQSNDVAVQKGDWAEKLKPV
jgi:hypothetical protein